MRSLVFLLALTGVVGAASIPRQAASSESRSASSDSVVEFDGPFHVPFKPGEKLSYAAKVNFLSAGSASMSVEGIEAIRGRPTFHTVFNVKGRVLFFHVDDHYESWFDTTTLVSLHHVQHIDETGTSR